MSLVRELLEAEPAKLFRGGKADSSTHSQGKGTESEHFITICLQSRPSGTAAQTPPFCLYHAGLSERSCVGGSSDFFGQYCAQAVKQCIAIKRYNPIKRDRSACGVPYRGSRYEADWRGFKAGCILHSIDTRLIW